jgi:hypothetical protein
MIKKPSNNYESPLIKLLQLDVNDIVTTSGNNFFEWGWDEDKPYDNGLFN